eukprot:1183195-Prorocentrum_minimum.AAC.1
MAAVHCAAGACQAVAVRALAGVGGDVHLPDAAGRTAMHYAALSGSLDTMLALASCGAKWTARAPPIGGDGWV